MNTLELYSLLKIRLEKKPIPKSIKRMAELLAIPEHDIIVTKNMPFVHNLKKVPDGCFCNNQIYINYDVLKKPNRLNFVFLHEAIHYKTSRSNIEGFDSELYKSLSQIKDIVELEQHTDLLTFLLANEFGIKVSHNSRYIKWPLHKSIAYILNNQ
jgi:hypothetical protein